MIGREKEEKTLNALYNSGSAELVAIYGRRRIGKTYLVDETSEIGLLFIMPDFLLLKKAEIV